MKKNLLIVGLMLALSLSASAQHKGFTFGFKVGPSFNWAGSATKTATNEGTRVGGDLGFIVEYNFTENYALVSGVNVGFLSGHYSFDNGALDLDSVFDPYRVDRIYKNTLYEIPVLFKMSTNELGNLPLRAYAQVGGGIGFVPQKVRVKDAIVPDEGTISRPENWSVTNKEFSLFRFSLKVGAGAEYAIQENLRVFAGLYYSHDFLNNINHLKPNYAGNYCNEEGEPIRERTTKLNLLQNRIGIEVGVLF